MKKKIVKFLKNLFCLLVLLSLFACRTQQPIPEYGMNEPVEGEEWRVTVNLVENKGNEFERGGITIRTDKTGVSLLYMQVQIENVNGAELGVGYLNNAEVRDNTGMTFHWWLAGMAPVVYYDFETQEGNPIFVTDPSAIVDYIFVVPEEATTFDLLWMDLPAIRLTVE